MLMSGMGYEEDCEVSLTLYEKKSTEECRSQWVEPFSSAIPVVHGLGPE
jgi:hypothetical protein